MKKLLAILIIPNLLWASCPTYTYPENPKLNQEVNNICASIVNPTINSGSATSLSVTTATITNLSVTNLTGFTSGKLRQVVAGRSTASTSTTSTTYIDTALSATITPVSSSDKIIVFVSGGVGIGANNERAILTIYRNSVDMSVNSYANYQSTVGGSNYVPYSMVGTDSPATTSLTTYKVRIKSAGGGFVYENPIGSDSNMIVVEYAP